MAWYDNLLQRGTNYFTGNNLTSQDPNTIRAINMQTNNPFDPNAVISDSGGVHQGVGPVAFSDRRYEDTGGVHGPLSFPRDTSGMYAPDSGSIHTDPTNWRENYAANLGSTYAEGPHQTNMADVSGQVGEYGVRPGQGIMATDQAQKKGFRFPSILGSILGNVKDQFQYRGAEGEAWDPNTGQMISAEDQDAQNALGGYYSAAATHDRRQNKRVRDMLARQKLGKKIGETNLQKLIDQGYGPKKVITDTVTDVTRPGSGYTGPQTQDFNPQQFAKAGRRADKPGGFTDPGRGSYGPHKADGGRIGYAFAGPVGVEQQTDFIEGPRGDNEFQETVVEGQEQPSREQLEALAMKIFQLPLEELDEQQLLVVYQTAMQGQPMEEAVQEEDVQFAARGGLASLL